MWKKRYSSKTGIYTQERGRKCDMLTIGIFFVISILSSVVGSICGIGGGVIIKPVLDATGIMSVSSISFLSGCTVLAMSIVSVYKNIRAKSAKLDLRIATSLALGAAAGGIMGKSLFQALKQAVGNENLVGMTQAIVLTLITLGTLVYTMFKKHIRTRTYRQVWLCVAIGIALGIMSSFLGIGGGPINLVVLAWFFSMSAKEAALSSLYIIMFSQITSLAQTFATGTVPDIEMTYLLFMVAGGILGGAAGSRINKKIDEDSVNRLFIILMLIIIGINICNAVKFGIA